VSAVDRFGNTPGDYVRALVCHFPREIRETRLLLMLHAYFDDSRQDEKPGVPGIYTLAGYVGEAPKWEKFADAWTDVLHAPPRRLEYLKTWQAYKLRDPDSMFYGWSDKERDDKLLSLARMANSHALISVQAVLRPAHYREIMGPYTEMRPYAFLLYSVAADLVKTMDRRWGVKDKIDIYFDRQTDENEDMLRAEFREFIADAPPELREKFAGIDFKDDRDVIPLQAADLFAWHFRRNIYEHDRGNEGLNGPVWDELLNLTRATGILDRENLKTMLRMKLAKMQRDKPARIMSYPDPSSGWGDPWK
jgi:hypothetical protein